MKKFALYTFAIAIFFLNHAEASPPRRVRASIDCGPFQLSSVTDQIVVTSDLTRATSQVIRFINQSRHIDTHLDLMQHVSQDSKLNGMLDIDGLAYEWRCVRARSGAEFVFVEFVCTEEDAKSCSTAMDAGSAEWTQIFDIEGKALFRKPPETPDAEQKRLKNLGIFDIFYSSYNADSTKQIYVSSSPSK